MVLCQIDISNIYFILISKTCKLRTNKWHIYARGCSSWTTKYLKHKKYDHFKKGYNVKLWYICPRWSNLQRWLNLQQLKLNIFANILISYLLHKITITIFTLQIYTLIGRKMSSNQTNIVRLLISLPWSSASLED